MTAAAETCPDNNDENLDTDGPLPELNGNSVGTLQPLPTNKHIDKRASHVSVNTVTVPEHPAILLAQEQEQRDTSPTRIAPMGSPAAEFLHATPNRNCADAANMTCDLAAIPRDKWNKRRSLSAIIISVLPIKTKAATVRRDVILRDQHAECYVTVWGNHTNIINECTIGKPITLQRICVTEYEGKLQIAMPKDSSVTMGNTQQTVPIIQWLHNAGSTFHSVTQVWC